jgi:hypothetical protein
MSRELDAFVNAWREVSPILEAMRDHSCARPHFPSQWRSSRADRFGRVHKAFDRYFGSG